jgi:hypothetical protein
MVFRFREFEWKSERVHYTRVKSERALEVGNSDINVREH